MPLAVYGLLQTRECKLMFELYIQYVITGTQSPDKYMTWWYNSSQVSPLTLPNKQDLSPRQ